jgi:hypothetical protein
MRLIGMTPGGLLAADADDAGKALRGDPDVMLCEVPELLAHFAKPDDWTVVLYADGRAVEIPVF